MTNPAASRAARALSRFGASKGGKASAAALSPEERKARGRAAIAARWKVTNRGRLTHDQERVMAFLRRASAGEVIKLVATQGPAGKRRRAAISHLEQVGKLKTVGGGKLSVSVVAL